MKRGNTLNVELWPETSRKYVCLVKVAIITWHGLMQPDGYQSGQMAWLLLTANPFGRLEE